MFEARLLPVAIRAPSYERGRVLHGGNMDMFRLKGTDSTYREPPKLWSLQRLGRAASCTSGLKDEPIIGCHNTEHTLVGILFYLTTLLLSIVTTGCIQQSTDEGLPATIRIGVLPDENVETLRERYEPLRSYLSESLGVPCELVYTESYDTLLESFGAGRVNLANFGGLTFVQAMTAYDAVPLIMRDIDARFTTYFVARTDYPASNVSNFEGAVFAFGSQLSTSGHLMPRHFLSLQDITPETFFREVLYSGAHDATIGLIRDGTADIGAVNAEIYRALKDDGHIEEDELRIVWETPPYTNYVWTVHSTLGREGRNKLRNAFLLLSPEDEEHVEILENLQAGGFLPANVDAFSDLKQIAFDLELLQ